ncbi:MAG: amidohydrolase family protein [Pseudomonadota bacterium]
MIEAVDSHIHIWDRTRGETFIAEKQFRQLTGQAFLPEEVPEMLTSTGASSAVLVHGPSSLSHTAHCLEMARAHSFFLSVIGWVNIRGGNWPQELAEFSKDRIFRGIRLMPVLDPEPEAFLRSRGVEEASLVLGASGQVLEVLAAPPLLPAVADIARTAPDTMVSLAHFGLPSGLMEDLRGWSDALSKVAANPNTIVKVSGLPLTGHLEKDIEMTLPHLQVLLDQFGPERMCYSSNWPVATALATPAHWRHVIDAAIAEFGLANNEKASVFETTALHHYSPRVI